MADISLISRVRTRRNNAKNICYLENIRGAEQAWTRTIENELNIDACVSYVFKLGIVLIE